MAGNKIKLKDQLGRVVRVGGDATPGATVGRDLRWPDGTIVKLSEIKNPAVDSSTGGMAPTVWKLIREIPANIQKLAKLAGVGFTTRSGDGEWYQRSIEQGEGIEVADGDGVAGNPTIGLADLPNSGAGTLQAITTDAKGRVTGAKDATITGTAGQIDVANGDAALGLPTLSLADVPDEGGGTLQKTAFDAKGRKTGTSAATTDDLEEGTGNLYYTDARASAAAPVQSVNGETGDVVLSAADVGADPAGSAALVVAAHVAEPDPHAQYAPLLRPQFTDWIGVGVAPDRPVVVDTTSNSMPAGTASFLIQGDTNKERLEMRAAGSSDPTFQAKRGGGSISSPAATPNLGRLIQIGGSGHDGSTWVTQNKGIIRIYATEAWTPTANGTAISILTTGNGSVATPERWKWEHDGNYLPCLDNAYTLGSGLLRVKEVFAATSVINTSDAREKTPVRPLTAAEIAAAIELGGETGVYQWLAMVEQKGEAAREHIGMTVQRAIEVMQSHGLDPSRYGFICYDQWPELPEVLGEDGEVVQEHRPEGDRYSFRMDELLAFIARGLAHRLDSLEQRLAAAGL